MAEEQFVEDFMRSANETIAKNSSTHVLEHTAAFDLALSQRPKPLRSAHLPYFDTASNPERFKKNAYLFERLFADAEILLNSPWLPSSLVGPHPYIFFGFADDSHLNASVQVLDDGKNLMCFHAGLPLIFYSVFCRMMAHPNVLPKIGNASLEVAEGTHAWRVPSAITDYEDVVQARFQAGQNSDNAEDIYPPRCAIRRGFARRLTQCALLFLLFHERAHLQYGHTKFKRMVNKKGPMSNMAFMEDNPEQSITNWAVDDGFTPLLEQSLEYDADACGANYSFRLHHLTPGFISEVSLIPHPLPSFPNNTLLTGSHSVDANPSESWGFAVATVFKLMGFDTNDLTSIGTFDGGHPPAIIRCYTATATVASLIEKFKIPPKETKGIIDGVIEANKAFGYITSDTPNQLAVHFHQASQSREVQEFLDKLESQWQDNIPYLRKFSWWPLTNDPEHEKIFADYRASLEADRKLTAQLRAIAINARRQKKSGRAQRPSRRQ